MRPLFKDPDILLVETALYQARFNLKSYWAGILSRLSFSGQLDDLVVHQNAIDIACDNILFSALESTKLDITVYSEDANVRTIGAGNKYTAIIDPIDGTHNALMGFPAFTANIALHDNERYVYSWVYDLSRDIVYTAQTGAGAFLQTPLAVKKLSVSNIKKLSDMKISIMRPNTDQYSNSLIRVLNDCYKLRVISCSSLEICLIASSAMDCLVDFSVPGHQRSCDIAAAALILNEAGGAIYNLKNSRRVILPPSQEAIEDYGPLVAIGWGGDFFVSEIIGPYNEI